MQYAYCSLREVISQLVRNTRLQDSSYLVSAHDWLYEGMELMQTQHTLAGKWKDLKISFHKAPLPCGLKDLHAVEYKGTRLPEGRGVRPASKDKQVKTNTWPSPTVMTSGVEVVPAGENHIIYKDKLEDITSNCDWNSRDYYYTELGHINTSFAEGTVTVYYMAIETDEDGFPLIPDNQNYKTALYWYCRAMMIGAGYPDKVFDFDSCMQRFEHVYMPRAIGEITYPSPDQVERRVNTLVRFIPDAGYYDSFFRGSLPEGHYNP